MLRRLYKYSRPHVQPYFHEMRPGKRKKTYSTHRTRRSQYEVRHHKTRQNRRTASGEGKLQESSLSSVVVVVVVVVVIVVVLWYGWVVVVNPGVGEWDQ